MIFDALIISLKVTIVSTILSLITGMILARYFTKHEFRLKGFFETLVILPMFIPPSVIGYLLLLVIGRGGIIGSIVYKLFDITIVFTWFAAALASFSVALPIMYQNAKGAFLSINPLYEDAARVEGASEWRVFSKITLPLALKGILTGVILSFGRAFGEFGATLMVAGNIPGKTQTVPMAIYYAVESGETAKANIMVLMVLVLSSSIIYLTNYFYKD
jgi:molybdate transport system permease protein